MKAQKLILFFLCYSAYVQGQELTGIWRGHFRSSAVYQRLMGDDDRYKMEVQIAQKNKSFQAVTYSYKSNFFYGKAEADGNEDEQTNKIRLREIKILESKVIGGDVCIMNCQLRYSKLGDEEFMEGTFSSMNTRDSSDCGNGTIFLHKVTISDFYEEPFLLRRKQELAIAKSRKGVPRSFSDKKNKNSNSTVPKPITAHKPSIEGNSGSSSKHTVTIKRPGNPTATTSIHKAAANPSLKVTDSTVKKIVHHTVTKPLAHRPSLATNNLSIQPLVAGQRDSLANTPMIPIQDPTPQVLTHRANELVKSITVHTADVELNIYDDGEIDNDTVSVYFDKKLIVSNARLTDKPIIVHLHFDQTNSSHELVMVAENEGDIPPNTSLMVVKAGDAQYDVRIVSTEQKNAVVIFKYQKSE